MEFLLTGIEGGYIAPTSDELGLKLRQLQAIASLVERAGSDAESVTRDELNDQFSRLERRLEASQVAWTPTDRPGVGGARAPHGPRKPVVGL